MTFQVTNDRKSASVLLITCILLGGLQQTEEDGVTKYILTMK